MFKKIFFLTFLVGLCLILGYSYIIKDQTPKPEKSYCAFCNKEVLSRQTFYEDDLILALYTHKPIFPGHTLVIPKRHVERFEDLTDREISQIGQVIKKVNRAVRKTFGTSSYLLLQKNGVESGQSVPHVHFHYIPRQSGDVSQLKFFLKLTLANFKKPISEHELKENVIKLRDAMKEQLADPKHLQDR